MHRQTDAFRGPGWFVAFPGRVHGLVLLACLMPAAPSKATTLVDGQASIEFHLSTWAGFGLTLNNFTGASGNALPVGPAAGTNNDLLDTNDGGFANPAIYTLNAPGVDVTPDPRRQSPVTSFSYDGSSPAALLASASGNIGLAGVTRWTVDPDLGGGQLVFGDYSLAYNSGDDRWELSNNIDFAVVAFWILNETLTTGAGDAFTLTGDLIGAPLLGLLIPGAIGQDFGNITFTAPPTSVPEPGAGLLLGSLGCALAFAAARQSHRWD